MYITYLYVNHIRWIFTISVELFVLNCNVSKLFDTKIIEDVNVVTSQIELHIFN